LRILLFGLPAAEKTYSGDFANWGAGKPNRKPGGLSKNPPGKKPEFASQRRLVTDFLLRKDTFIREKVLLEAKKTDLKTTKIRLGNLTSILCNGIKVVSEITSVC